MLDQTVPHGWHYYWKTANFNDLDDALIETIVDHASLNRSPRSYSVMFHLGGAITDVDPQATAYPHRDAAHSLNINAVWLPDDRERDQQIAWARDFHTAVQPHQTGAYLNFLDRDDQHRVRAALGDPNHARLHRLRARWDPHDIFRTNRTPRAAERQAAVPRSSPSRLRPTRPTDDRS